MRRLGNSEPKGSNKKTASPQHSTPMDYEYSRPYARDPSGPMAMNYSWPAQEPPITRLPNLAQMNALMQQFEQVPITRLPRYEQVEAQLQQPSNSEHLSNISELDTKVDLKDTINLEDWLHAARDKTRSSGHDTSKINEPGKSLFTFDTTESRFDEVYPDDFGGVTSGMIEKLSFTFDGNESDLDGSNANEFGHDTSRISKPERSSSAFDEDKARRDADRDVDIRIWSSSIAVTTSEDRDFWLPPSPIWSGRKESGPDKRKISDNVQVSSQVTTRAPPGVKSWKRPLYPQSNYPNIGAEYMTQPSSKNNDRMSPGETSNAVMMRFERNAKELDAASCAATDASHRSISDEEENIPAILDPPREPREDESPTAAPMGSFDGVTYLPEIPYVGKSEVVPHEDPILFNNRRVNYLEYNEVANPNIQDTTWTRVPENDSTLLIDPRPFSDTTFVPTIPSSSQQTPAVGVMAQPPYRNSFAAPTEFPFFSRFPEQEQMHRRQNPDVAQDMINTEFNIPKRTNTEETLNDVTNEISYNISNQISNEISISDSPIDPSDLRETPTRLFQQNGTTWVGSISKENPMVETNLNLSVGRDAQSGDHRNPFTFEAYTDSGYASNTTRALKPSEVLGQIHQTEELPAGHTKIESRSVSTLDENIQHTDQEDDVASVYSDASTISTTTKARYIDGLADDLAQIIQPYHLNDEVFQHIVEKLPELLKAFALTFGHHESSTMHRDVMVFIHKYRRQIVKTLNDQILMEEAENQNRDQANQFSLNEKMDLWLRSGESIQGGELDNPEHNDNHDSKNFDGRETKDDDDDDDEDEDEEDHDFEADETELPGLAAYRSFIRGAPAYSWFLNNIRRECNLAPPEPNLIGEIRNAILEVLPSSPKISRRKPAETFNVSFMVDWDPVAFLREEEYTERPEDAIEGAITLTGSTVSAQALTCGGYLRQTWPSTGEQILDLIKLLVSGKSRASDTLLNGSSLTVSYHPSQEQGSSTPVWVDAHGTAACVAEIAEQLAWLASALRSSPFPQKMAYSRPFIDGIRIGHVTYEETTYICKIGVELHEGNGDSEITNGECWHGLFGSPVVVQGFPIPRRSEGESLGLEIPLNIMAGLIQARRVGSFGGKTLLKGFATMLLPTKRTKGIVTWHLVQSRNGERISYLEAGNVQTADIQMPELEKSRHVLGWCPEMKLYAGAADASYLIKGSRLPRPSGQGGLSDASLSLGHLITGGAPFSEGRKDIRLRRNSYIVRMKWISQKFVILWDVEDKRGWLVNGASALLHLVRASLAQDMFDNKFGPLCLFSTKEFQEASRLHHTDAALEVLLNPNNLKTKIYPEEDDFIRFKAYVEDFSDLLEKMLDYQSRIVNQNIPRSLLEGWDFNDLATGRDPIYPRESFLNQEAFSWVDFTRSLHAITLFGRSFGEVIQPAEVRCSAWVKVPCGRSYLAASATDLYKVMESDGDPYSVPMRLTHDILWYTSKETSVQCKCNSEGGDDTHCDIAQVLLPSRLQHELSGTCSQLPPKSGAIIFGYNNTHRWFWGDTGDPSRTPNESNSMSPFNKGVRGSHFSDSGIGKSIGSSASITDSTSNRLNEAYTEATHAVNSDTEDHQSSLSTNNKRNNYPGSSIVSSPLAIHYKVGIVCALHVELMAIRASFDKAYEQVAIAGEDPNYYALGNIEGHNVVAVCLPHGVYGTNAAADVTSNMKRSFPGLKFCLLVGIGAGVPSQRNDIRLGDVVISTPKGGYSGVLPYDMIKSTDSGAFELNGYLSPPPTHLMCAISELESDPSRSSTPLHKYLQQIGQCKEQYKHPGVASDRLFASHYTHNGDLSNISNCDQCDFAYEIRRPPRSSTHPEIHYGLIASGNQVMKSAKIRDKLSREHNVLCFEMEGAGIMNNFPCLIIRGICDYADSHKNKRWQNYAAATAAAYAKLLLSRLRTADGFESEPRERLIRKRTATTEWDEDMPVAKRSRS